VDLECGYDGGDKECIHNFGGEALWKICTSKIRKEMGGLY
jgi:hypothetical protein